MLLRALGVDSGYRYADAGTNVGLRYEKYKYARLFCNKCGAFKCLTMRL
jgi:hypothetical protein